jgi:hypothetical protein
MSLGIQTPRLFHLLCAKRRRRISSAVNGFDFVDKVRQRVLRQATRVSPSRGSLCAPPRDAAKSPTTSPSGTLRRANRTGRRSLPSCKQPLSRPKRTYPRRVTTVQVVSLRSMPPARAARPRSASARNAAREGGGSAQLPARCDISATYLKFCFVGLLYSQAGQFLSKFERRTK